MTNPRVELLTRIINSGSYSSKEDMKINLGTYLDNKKISQEEHDTLEALLDPKAKAISVDNGKK